MHPKSMRNVFVILCLASYTVACSTGPVDPEHSPYYAIPTGSSLVLQQEVVIPANKAAIYIQYGEVKTYKEIDKYYPHCKFEVRTIREQNQTVKADTFIVTRTATDETIVRRQNSPFRYVDIDGGGISFIEMFRIMYLHSDQQPDVLRLSCGHRAVSPHYEHLTVSEVRKALGGLMTLGEPGKPQ